MEPPGTTSPPNRLMPRRCAFESRPFLELPNPFLCAIATALRDDLGHLQLGETLPVSDRPLVLLLAFELENHDFLRAVIAGDGCHDLRRDQLRFGAHFA